MTEKEFHAVMHFILKSEAFQGDELKELERLNAVYEGMNIDSPVIVKLWPGAGYYTYTYIVYSLNHNDIMQVLDDLEKQYNYDIPYINDMNIDDYEYNDERIMMLDSGRWIYSENLTIKSFNEYEY